MITKAELKSYSFLLQKKYRKETGKFLVEGKKLILEALNSQFECELIVSTNQFDYSNPDFFEEKLVKSFRHETVKQIEIEKLSDTKTPQGVVGIFKQKVLKETNKKAYSIVALENISDPGNLGTIIRSSDWFGFSSIILSNDCAELFNPKVIRSSAGSVFHLNLKEENNFYESLKLLQSEGYKIICADLNGIELTQFKKPEKYVAVFCNEANGPTQELLSMCDYKITIPKKGKAESLNVASASAVILSYFANMQL